MFHILASSLTYLRSNFATVNMYSSLSSLILPSFKSYSFYILSLEIKKKHLKRKHPCHIIGIEFLFSLFKFACNIVNLFMLIGHTKYEARKLPSIPSKTTSVIRCSSSRPQNLIIHYSKPIAAQIQRTIFYSQTNYNSSPKAISFTKYFQIYVGKWDWVCSSFELA